MWQKLPIPTNNRRKQREFYYAEAPLSSFIKDQKLRGKPKYKIVEEGSSADDSTTTNYSSGLSIDVSNEMAAVNRDIEALLERYENVFDHVLTKHDDSKVMREHVGKQAWDQDNQKVLAFEEDLRRRRRNRKRGVKTLTPEQLKLLSMDKPPLDKLSEIPIHLLKPRLPPSMKEKKSNFGNNQHQVINDNLKDNAWLTKEDILKTMYGDLSRRVCIENSQQDNPKVSKNGTYYTSHIPCNSNPSQISETNCGDFTCCNEYSKLSNINLQKCIHSHCCNHNNKQFTTPFPNEENNWRTLLSSPKCKIIPVCELQTSECHLNIPKQCVCNNSNKPCFDDKVSENKVMFSEENNHVEKGINTEPFNWKDVIVNNESEISHSYADIKQNYHRKQNSLNEFEYDMVSKTEEVNPNEKNTTINDNKSKKNFTSSSDNQNNQDTMVGKITHIQNRGEIVLDSEAQLVPKNDECNKISLECPKKDTSSDIEFVNRGNVLTAEANSHKNQYGMVPIFLSKNNSYTQTNSDDPTHTSLTLPVVKENENNGDEVQSYKFQHRVPPVTIVKKNSHTQTIFDSLNVQGLNKTTVEDKSTLDLPLYLDNSDLRNRLDDHSDSVLNILTESKEVVELSKHQTQNPKRRPNSPPLKYEKTEKELVIEENQSAGGDTLLTSNNDEAGKSLAHFIDQTLKRDFLNSKEEEEEHKPADINQDEKENENLDTTLCVEIIRRITDSMVKCENSGQSAHMTKESVYLQQLKQLRTDYLKHIQREIKHIEDLDKFLSKFGITAQLVYSTDNPKN